MSLLRITLFVLAAGACAAPRVDPAPTPVEPKAAAEGFGPIDASELRRDLEVFASDSFRGRESGTAGERASARFLAERARVIGLEPAGDSGFLHRVPLLLEQVADTSRFTVTRGGQTVRLRVGRDVVPLISLGDGVFARQRAEGPVVFAGYGIHDPATGRDDLENLDVRGRVVVVVMGAPAGADEATRRQLEGQEGLSIRLQRLVPMGPSAVILLFSEGGETLYDQFVPGLMRGMSLGSRGTPPPPDAQRPVPMILLGRVDRAAALLPSQWPEDTRAQALPATFTGHAVTERTAVTGYNVVAALPGSDPRWNRTYVALGAHHDHVGVQDPVAGDSIANGADDDGSGSMAMLAVARSLAAGPPPRRSVLFVWHAAEEKGLLGSEHFVARPTVPIDSIVAMINMDMIGRNGGPTEDFLASGGQASEDRLFVVGPSAAPNGQSRALGNVLDSVNARLARPFTFDRAWDDPEHPERIYFRSDHFNYAQKGIPVLFLTTGLHQDYHKVSDEVSRIYFTKLARVSTLVRDLTSEVANSTSRPR